MDTSELREVARKGEGSVLMQPQHKGGSVFALAVMLMMLLALAGCAELSNSLPENKQSNVSTDEAGVEECPPLELVLVAVGDNLIHYPIYEQAWSAGDGYYDFKASYAEVQSVIYSADIAFLNQEIPAAGEEYVISSYPLFNSPTELVQDMAEFLGIDVVNMSSNHSLDKGLHGLLRTIDAWKEHNVLPIGVWPKEAENGNIALWKYVAPEGGQELTLAFLAYTYDLNGMDLPDSMMEGWQIGALCNWPAMEADVLQAKELADLVIMSLHWGYEGWLEPNEQQQELAEQLAQLNVDLILGHHPHVIQPVAELERADGRMMPVFYSLGNFISNQVEAENMLGMLAVVTIYKDSEGASILAPRAVPLVTHFTPGFTETRTYFLDAYSEAQGYQHGIRGYDGRFGKTWVELLFAEVVDEQYHHRLSQGE